MIDTTGWITPNRVMIRKILEILHCRECNMTKEEREAPAYLVRYRSASTGKYVTQEYAECNPDTTVCHRVALDPKTALDPYPPLYDLDRTELEEKCEKLIIENIDLRDRINSKDQ